MLHPVGPLPASVYWRRRVVAFGGAIAAVLLAGWLLGGGGGPRASGAPVGDVSSTSAAPTGSASSTDAAEQTGAPSAISGAPPAVDQSGTGGTGSSAGGTGSSASDTSGAGADPTATASGTVSESAATTPGPCPDRALTLTVRPAAAAYRVGDEPVITLTVQNVSTATCTRDLGAGQQEVLLYAGTTRLWSSNDCYPGGQRNVRPLTPGQRVTFSVTWSGLSSHPGCTGTRSRVRPGSYRLVGRLGTLASRPATLTLR